MAGKIKLLIVEDSMFFRACLVKGLSQANDIEIVGEATDPYEARDLLDSIDPDVMTMDIEMPYMNGIEFMRALLPVWPVPVIVVSSLVQRQPDAMSSGAADFLAKPTDRSPDSMSAFIPELINRIRTAYRRKNMIKTPAQRPFDSVGNDRRFTGFVALGASTGGTQATAKVLRALPANCPPFIIVQHMPPDFTRMYADNMNSSCAMKIREVKDGDMLEQGLVLIAPGGSQQCEIVKRGINFYTKIFAAPKVSGHCPSVDVLFRSVAQCAAANDAIGVLLTGMGADGAEGLLAMKNKGMYTIGQDEKTSVVYGMPREAYEMGAVVRQAAIDDVSTYIMNYVKDLRK